MLHMNFVETALATETLNLQKNIQKDEAETFKKCS